MKAPLSVLLAATLLAAPAAAQDMADSVVDKSTKRAYPVHIKAGTTDQVHTLTGIGVRTRTMLNIKVYAVGLYIDAEPAKVALADWAGMKPKELEKNKAMFQRMLEMDMGMTLRLIMTRDVGGEKMAEAFEKALAPRVEKAAAEMNMADGTEALAQFRGYFGVDKVTDDSELIFSCVDGTLYTTIQGAVSEAIESPALCWALFDVYVGEKPISKGAKKNIGKGMAAVLASAPSDEAGDDDGNDDDSDDENDDDDGDGDDHENEDQDDDDGNPGS